MKRTTTHLLLALVFSAALSGCDNKAALEAVKTQGMSLVGEHAPQLKGLTDKLGAVEGMLGKIPTNVPGADALKKTLAGHQDKLKGLSSLFGGAEGSFNKAIEAGDMAGVKSLMTKFEGSKDTIASLTTGLGDTEKSVGALMSKVKDGTAYLTWSKKLPGGFELIGSDKGIEHDLVEFIENKGMAVDSDKWFNFDRLLFKTGSADLDMAKSKHQLEMVHQIFKAYPAVKATVGGYTDNTGDAAKNVELSKKRADDVRNKLVSMGIDAARFKTEGYGAEHPICPANDTPKCRQQNRRISVNITAK